MARGSGGESPGARWERKRQLCSVQRRLWCCVQVWGTKWHGMVGSSRVGRHNGGNANKANGVNAGWCGNGRNANNKMWWRVRRGRRVAGVVYGRVFSCVAGKQRVVSGRRWRAEPHGGSATGKYAYVAMRGTREETTRPRRRRNASRLCQKSEGNAV